MEEREGEGEGDEEGEESEERVKAVHFAIRHPGASSGPPSPRVSRDTRDLASLFPAVTFCIESRFALCVLAALFSTDQ